MDSFYVYIIIAIIAAVIIFGLFAHDQNKRIVKTRYELQSKNVKNAVRIVHISDMHSTSFKNIIKKIDDEKPNIIAITGDLINDKRKNQDKMLEYVNEMSKIALVFYVTGNHERRLDNFDEIMKKISESGAHVLLDRCETVNVNDSNITILGLDEKQGTFEAYKQMAKGTFKYRDSSIYFDMINDFDGFKLVLSHFPENFALINDLSYNKYDFDLMLAGHAHGGQLRLPFIGPVLSPGQGWFPKYACGKHGDRPCLIVSRGMGNSEFPLRLFNHPEIIVIDIIPSDK